MKARRSPRLSAEVKAARKQYRNFLRAFTWIPGHDRTEITRRFIRMMVMDILHHDPTQADTFTGIDHALNTGTLAELEPLALRVGELRERLHGARAAASAQTVTVH